MRDFKLPDRQDQELWLPLSHESEPFLVRFNVYEQEIDLCAVFAGNHSLLALISDETSARIEQAIYTTLKQADEEDRLAAKAA